MRLIYSSDLHGNLDMYEGLFELALGQGAATVVVGGDLLPREIALDRAVATQRSFVYERLAPLLTQFRAAGGGPVFLLAGNDDWAAAIAALNDLEQEGLCVPLHGRVAELGAGLHIAGYSCVPVTPFSIKDFERLDTSSVPPFSFEMAYTSGPNAEDLPRRTTAAAIAALPSIAEDLEAIAQRSDPASTVYVTHAPPHGTLDVARGRHFGSAAVGQFIARQRPPLALHGHIHEAPRDGGRYAARLGSTWCVNPGNDAVRLHAVTLNTDDIAGTLWHTVYGRLTGDG